MFSLNRFGTYCCIGKEVQTPHLLHPNSKKNKTVELLLKLAPCLANSTRCLASYISLLQPEPHPKTPILDFVPEPDITTVVVLQWQKQQQSQEVSHCHHCDHYNHHLATTTLPPPVPPPPPPPPPPPTPPAPPPFDNDNDDDDYYYYFSPCCCYYHHRLLLLLRTTAATITTTTTHKALALQGEESSQLHSNSSRHIGTCVLAFTTCGTDAR